jgi:hypothetical protein
MRCCILLGVFWVGLVTAQGAARVSQWTPIFQGIDQATGTNEAGATGGSLSVNALRIDLQAPGIKLVVTPPVTNDYVPEQRETLLQTQREFLVENGLQVAVNAAYFSPGGYENPSGTPATVEGAVISAGRVVSLQSRTNDSMSAMMFGTNNQPRFHFVNWPAADTRGIYNAVAGMYPLVSNGVNFAYFYTNANDGVHQLQPRTAFGLSQDNRYLIMMTIDGRQEFSTGAFDYETAEFLLLFGAWNGMNMDGGGSTCMVKADDFGDAVDINVNSFQWAVGRPGSQRAVGANFGVRSPVPISGIKDLVATPGASTAIVTWRTDEAATTQVEFGLTKALGNATPLDSRKTKTHIATLTGLAPGSNYYFRAVSSTDSTVHRRGSLLRTTNVFNRTMVFDVTKSWRYTTNSLDGLDWTARDYDDSAWLGPDPGLLFIEDNPGVAPRNTVLPQPLVRTYYFRTHFDFEGSKAGLSLLFSNYVDDGAVFSLNGHEIYRLRMPAEPTIISNSTAATLPPCGSVGDVIAGCHDLFVDNANFVVQGDNLLAVEVHNRSTGPDIVFGTALYLDRPPVAAVQLNLFLSGDEATLYWNGVGYTLQRATQFPAEPSDWVDLGNISPVVVGNTGTAFYRLRD